MLFRAPFPASSAPGYLLMRASNNFGYFYILPLWCFPKITKLVYISVGYGVNWFATIQASWDDGSQSREGVRGTIKRDGDCVYSDFLCSIRDWTVVGFTFYRFWWSRDLLSVEMAEVIETREFSETTTISPWKAIGLWVSPHRNCPDQPYQLQPRRRSNHRQRNPTSVVWAPPRPMKFGRMALIPISLTCWTNWALSKYPSYLQISIPKTTCWRY